MSEQTISAQDRADIDEILREFDFDKVERCMLALRWEWHSAKGIPTQRQIKAYAQEFMEGFAETSAYDSDCVGMGDCITVRECAGFKVSRQRHGGLLLEFIATSWEAER